MGEHRNNAFSLVAAGDAMVTRPLLPYEGNSSRFDAVLELLRGGTASVLNLETGVHDYEHPDAGGGGTAMRTPPAVLDDIREMGCDMVATANNHVFDYGRGGLLSTMSNLRDAGIPFAGSGRNLFEARKPTYVETGSGRVALLGTTTMISAGSEASDRTTALEGRPGVSPLRVELIQRLGEADLENLKSISETLGWEDIKERWLKRGFYTSHDWNQEEYFHFSDMKFQEAADDGDVGFDYEVNEADRTEILEWIEEASANADWVVVSLHSHYGLGELRILNEKHPDSDSAAVRRKVPEYMVETARKFVDAGADAVVGTGPHELRGIEVYDGKPIFYSLGNFIMQRSGVTRFPPHMYHRYGMTDYTKTSKIFDSRFGESDDQGRMTNDEFWETALVECDFDEDKTLSRCTIHPISLQQSAPRQGRGVPVVAEPDHAEKILADLDALSEPFGTDIEVADGVGIIEPP